MFPAHHSPLPYDDNPETGGGSSKTTSHDKQYIYIVQASLETTACKIGMTGNLEGRLKQYNSQTGKSKDNHFTYLYTCEVKDMVKLEKAITNQFSHLRQQEKREMYFFNDKLFKDYVAFIEGHNLFIRRFAMKEDKKPTVKVLPITSPSLGERGITFKDVMQRAKRRTDNNEFYTRYEDVEKELKMYNKSVWKNKTVFCNCDDAVGDPTGKDEKNTSAFALYFIRHFKDLELKKLICTHYSGEVDLFSQGAKGYIFTKSGFSVVGDKQHPKDYTGSFDDPLSIEILEKQADIVCTNPPFARCIEYWHQVVNSGKKFLIISNVAIALTRAYIHYFKDGKAWPGYHEVDSYLNPYVPMIGETPSQE